MAVAVTSITDVDAQENAIAEFINKSTGLKCFFEGYEFERKRPYALANLIISKKTGKPWTSKDFTGGAATTYFQSAFLTFDIDIYADAYDSAGSYIKESSKYYMQRFIDNFHIEQNKSDLDALGIKVSLASQNSNNSSIKEEDKWIKMSTIECVFNYIHEFKVIDTDTLTQIAEVELLITE